MVYVFFILEIVKAIPSDYANTCLGNNVKVVKERLMVLL